MSHTILDSFKKIRTKYHNSLCKNVLGVRAHNKGINVADTSSKSSRTLARIMASKMKAPLCSNPPAGQTAGSLFGKLTADFIEEAFGLLQHIRPGDWIYSATGATSIGGFNQYQHLLDLKMLLDKHPDIKAALGGDYLVSPDIIIARKPITEKGINKEKKLLDIKDKNVAALTPIRRSNQGKHSTPILHASISCKWTMRSDRAQNTRTEALNLIRNRKGHSPHIVAVTIEPLPTRIASIAMGTGDIDCTYHSALYELVEAADESGLEDQADMLRMLIDGKRLRDISDLPFDLAI